MSCSSRRKINGRTSSFALVLYNICELMNFTHQVCTYNVNLTNQKKNLLCKMEMPINNKYSFKINI